MFIWLLHIKYSMRFQHCVEHVILTHCVAHLHAPILSAILGVEMYTKELTPEMVGAHFAEVRSSSSKELIMVKGHMDS